MKQEQETNIKWIRLMPIFAALFFVPLIVTVKQYDTGLAGYEWFSSSEQSIDLFLYWKGRALILLALIMLFFLVVRLFGKNQFARLWEKARCPEMLCVLCYILFAAISALCSEYRDFALGGSYEQWEGLNVLAAYVMLLFYTYVSAGTEKAVKYILYSLVLGGFVIGLIGTFQYLQMDFFRSDAGAVLMNLLSESKLKFRFNFSDGWVYSTLYNPNYVGSYAALTLPPVIAVAIMEWKKISPFWNVLAIVTTCLMTITLLGSQSMTGIVSVVAALVFVVIYTWRRIVKRFGYPKITAGAVGLAVLFAILCFLFPEQIRFGTDKLFRPTEDYHEITSMLSSERGLRVETVKGDVFYVVCTKDASRSLSVTGEDGTEIALREEKSKGYYNFVDSRFENFRLYPERVEVQGKVYTAVRIFNPTINKKWTIANVDGAYKVYTIHRKLASLREIPSIGFGDNLHFGDKRGYIWSRTFPLLKSSILLGSGPDTFTEAFPNDDYVGKTNMNYDGVAVTKPHNMYLQIWVQTGLVSLLAFLALFFLYFISSLRLYFRRELGTIETFGVALMTGCFAYMVAGLANDSTVSVAPVFWGLLGLGLAVNAIVRKKDKLDSNQKKTVK